MKCGNWLSYDQDGLLTRSTQYHVESLDTLTNVRYLFNERKGWINSDTINIETDSSFFDYFPCLSAGKNGIEIIYEAGKLIEVRKYNFDKLIYYTRKKRLMKKLIVNSTVETYF